MQCHNTHTQKTTTVTDCLENIIITVYSAHGVLTWSTQRVCVCVRTTRSHSESRATHSHKRTNTKMHSDGWQACANRLASCRGVRSCTLRCCAGCDVFWRNTLCFFFRLLFFIVYVFWNLFVSHCRRRDSMHNKAEHSEKIGAACYS